MKKTIKKRIDDLENRVEADDVNIKVYLVDENGVDIFTGEQSPENPDIVVKTKNGAKAQRKK
jgi:hypothetical protein